MDKNDSISPIDEIDQKMLESFHVIGDKGKYDCKVKEKIDAAKRKYGERLNKFQEYLEKYPSLALNVSLGRKLFKEITAETASHCTISGDWFRGRVVNESRVYNNGDMLAPPPGTVGDGRYHHAGQSVLYLSEKKDIAVGETIENLEDSVLVWLQEYTITEIPKILDLTNDWSKIELIESAAMIAVLSSRVLNQTVEDRDKKGKPQYSITCFVSDCARSAGFNGIRYTSSRGYGDNVVIFNWDETNIKPKGDPKIFIHKPKSDKDKYNRSFEYLF
jgi:hypothetical protein